MKIRYNLNYIYELAQDIYRYFKQMGRKRLSKTPMKTNDPYRQKITKNTDLIGRLLDDMSQFNYNKDILIPLTEEIQKL